MVWWGNQRAGRNILKILNQVQNDRILVDKSIKTLLNG